MLISSLLSVIAPHECLGCGAEGLLLCASCSVQLRPAAPRCYGCQRFDAGFRTCPSCRRTSAVYAVHAGFRYEDLAKELLWRLKFGRAGSAAREAAALLNGQLDKALFGDILVTHAPTAPSRVRQRGYDQAALLARSLSKKRQLQYAPLLARVDKRKQVGASRGVRKQQLSGAFRPVHKGRIEGATILLVDDVVTTGATLEAAAATLKAAGARRVIGVVFAQA